MANITILDSGYPNIINSGTQESSSNMANGGTAIELKAVEVSYGIGSGIDNSPVVSKYSETELNFASTENAKMTITGLIDRKVTADMDLIPEFKKLVTTKGIKVLYYNSTTDGYRDLTDSLGSTDSYHLSNTTPHLHIRVRFFTIRHTGRGTILRYTLTCEETA